jgi:hypothetical protein
VRKLWQQRSLLRELEIVFRNFGNLRYESEGIAKKTGRGPSQSQKKNKPDIPFCQTLSRQSTEVPTKGLECRAQFMCLAPLGGKNADTTMDYLDIEQYTFLVRRKAKSTEIPAFQKLPAETIFF